MDNVNIKKALDEADKAKLKEKDPKKLLVLSNMPLVISVMIKINSDTSIEEEVFQQGCKGLVLASEKYDPESGVKFGSFAVWDIRSQIYQFIAKYKYSVPQGVFYENMKRIRGGSEDIEFLDTTPISSIKGECSWYGKNDDNLDSVSDQSDIILKLIEKMPDRVKTIVMMRFGFKDGYEYTWREIGEKLGTDLRYAQTIFREFSKLAREQEQFIQRFEDLCRG